MKTLLERIEMFTEEKDSEYQKFFKKKLKEFGVDEPDELSTEDKKKFYSEIEKEWDKEEDHVDESEDEDEKKDKKKDSDDEDEDEDEDDLDEALDVDKVLAKLKKKKESLEKKVESKLEAVSRAEGARKSKGQRIQSSGEAKARAALQSVRLELSAVEAEIKKLEDK